MTTVAQEYHITLEEGAATKEFQKMTKHDIEKLGKLIMERVIQRGEVHGLQPVISNAVRKSHSKNGRSQSPSKPVLHAVAGANGVGKTTIFDQIIPKGI